MRLLDETIDVVNNHEHRIGQLEASIKNLMALIALLMKEDTDE